MYKSEVHSWPIEALQRAIVNSDTIEIEMAKNTTHIHESHDRTRIEVNGSSSRNVWQWLLAVAIAHIFLLPSYLVPMSNRMNNNSVSVCVREHCAYKLLFYGVFSLSLTVSL